MLFNLEDFKSADIKKTVKKINQLHSKRKIDKMLSMVNNLEGYTHNINSEECRETVFIWSTLSENYPQIISKKVIKRLKELLKSENDETRLNSIILYGVHFIEQLKSNDSVSGDDIDEFLEIGFNDKIPQIQGNIIFFIEDFPEDYFDYILPKMDKFLSVLEDNENLEVIDAVLNIIQKVWDTSLEIKVSIFNKLMDIYFYEKNSDKRKKILDYVASGIPLMKEYLEEHQRFSDKDLKKFLEKRGPIAKIYDLKAIAEKEGMSLKDVEKNFAKIKGDDEIFRFLYQDKKRYYVEIETPRLITLLTKDKVKVEKLIHIFGEVELDSISLLNLLIKKMVKSKIIKGFLTKSYFFSYDYLKELLMKDIRRYGKVNLDDHAKQINHSFIVSIAEDINKETKFTGMFNKNKSEFLTLNSLIKQIEKICIKESMFDLSNYKEVFSHEDFLLIEDGCKKDFFTKYHTASNWLTNIGYTRLTNNFRQGQTVGFINISKIAEETEIPLEIAQEILQDWLEAKPGIWDNSNKRYYFMRYIKSKIERLDKSADEEKTKQLINALADELNIDATGIEQKLKQEKADIIKQIKERPRIDIQVYTRALGMRKADFIKFVNELNIEYIIQQNSMIFDKKQIDRKKKEVRREVLDQARRSEYLDVIGLSKKLRISEKIILETIKKVHNNKSDDKDVIKGILIDDSVFITERGINRKIMNSSDYISQETIIEDRPLNEEEQMYVIYLLEKLIDDGKLIGVYDEESHEFRSEEVKSIDDYVDSKSNAEDVLKLYLGYMKDTWEKIKEMYVEKKDIRPGDLKRKDYLLKRVMDEFQKWELSLNDHIKTAEKTYDNLDNITEDDTFGDIFDSEKKEVKRIDGEQIMSDFRNWTGLISLIEQETPNLGSLKKKLLGNPEDEELKEKLGEIYKKLKFDQDFPVF